MPKGRDVMEEGTTQVEKGTTQPLVPPAPHRSWGWV